MKTFLVWARTVLIETMSSPAVSGPLSSVRRSRRTSSSLVLSSSTRPCCWGRGGGPWAARTAAACSADPLSRTALQQGVHRRAGVEEDADEAFDGRPGQRLFEGREGPGRVAGGVVGEGQQ